jgi:hypothetical protein
MGSSWASHSFIHLGIHGVGHGALQLYHGDWEPAIRFCEEYDELGHSYSCGSGVYMEFMKVTYNALCSQVFYVSFY